jgi:hypothetical protein
LSVSEERAVLRAPIAILGPPLFLCRANNDDHARSAISGSRRPDAASDVVSFFCTLPRCSFSALTRRVFNHGPAPPQPIGSHQRSSTLSMSDASVTYSRINISASIPNSPVQIANWPYFRRELYMFPPLRSAYTGIAMGWFGCARLVYVLIAVANSTRDTGV